MASPQKENGYTAIANEIMEALARFRIPGEARQMLDVIIRKTYGYNKKEDMIATSQFCDFTGLKSFIIHRARKRLLLANLITVSKNANSQVLSYSFQKNYKKWIAVSKKAHCAKKEDTVSKKVLSTVTIIDAHKRQRTKDNIQKKEKLSTEDFITALKQNPAYSHIDINTELNKMDAWFIRNPDRKKSLAFINNWLNKIEKPQEDPRLKALLETK